MDRLNRYEILEECLRQVQSGKSLDEALSPYGKTGEELRPLLETAVIASILRPPREVPTSAENRSRARFLSAAGEARARPARSTLRFLPRISAAVLLRVALIALLMAALLGTGITSAKAIPGDTLYPVKIAVEKARLSFTSDPESRLTLEQSFDQERVEESHRLLLLGRNQNVSFAGYLEREEGDRWEVGDIHLILTPEQNTAAAGLENLYVDVQGQASGEQMRVNQLRVRLFEFTGVIEQVETNRLTVSGVRVTLDGRSQLRLQPAARKTVRVTAVQQKDGNLVALLVVPSETPGETVTYRPVILPTLPPAGEDHHETPDPHEIEDGAHEATGTPTFAPTQQPVDYVEETQPPEEQHEDNSHSSGEDHQEDDEHKSEEDHSED